MRLPRLAIVLLAVVACKVDTSTAPQLQPLELRPLTVPENLVSNIEVLYNDNVRTAAEKKAEYEKLLGPPAGCDSCPSFIFDFQPKDEVNGTPDTWGRVEEIQAQANIFQAKANRQIRELRLQIEFLPAEDLNDPSRPGWKEVFASNVHLRLLTTPSDGYDVHGAQAQFRVYPAKGRWFIGEWIDLPRPGSRPSSASVDPSTWGSIKAAYLR